MEKNKTTQKRHLFSPLPPLYLVLALATNAFACPLLEHPKNLKTAFIQTRQIMGIKTPIVSSGNFTLEIGKQIIWETIKPFYSKVIISEEGFKVQDQNYSAGPLKELSSILLQLHSGNLEVLKEKFSYKCEVQNDNKYHLLASPLDSNLQKMFKEIEISGVSEPESINYLDSRGDKTLVELKK